MGKLQVNGTIQATGSLVTGSKFSLTKTAATKSTATDQDLVINYNLPSGTSLTDSNAPGVGFHVGNTCWGQIVYNNSFKFYNGGDFSSLTNVYANNFIGNLSGNATSASAAPWSGITGKPSTFPPSSHTHNYLSWAIHASGTPDFNNVTTTAWNSICAGNTNSPTTGNHGLLLSEMNVGTPFQIWYPDNSLQMWKRYKLSGSGWTAWSNTWEINITGSAGSVAWSGITGKPSSFTPASHTHNYQPLESTTFSIANTTYVSVRTPNRTAAMYYEFWDSVGWAGIRAGDIYDNNNRVLSTGNYYNYALTCPSRPNNSPLEPL